MLREFSMPKEESTVLSELAAGPIVVGIKQSTRAAREGRAKKLFFALDADPMVLKPLEALCAEREIPSVCDCSMAQLGEAAGIAVGASVVALLTEPQSRY